MAFRVTDDIAPPIFEIFRLVEDHAIIAERRSHYFTPSEDACAHYSPGEPWQIARIIGFHDWSGAHVVRYASHLISSDSVLCGSEGGAEVFKDSIADQLKFDGREAMLVLASRQYYIVHRDEMGLCDHDSAQDVDMADVEGHSSERVRLTPPSEVLSVLKERQLLTYISLLLFILGVCVQRCELYSGEISGADHFDELSLRFGARVESNVGYDGQWRAFTVLSSSIRGASSDGRCVDAEPKSLRSQVESSNGTDLQDSTPVR
ncbi:MAG: hypothetical protein ACRDL7_15930, partial [Gaiellaceae bacterium]